MIDLDDAISGDIDTFNELLCGLTGEPYLQDIGWTVVGTQGAEIILLVTGSVEEEA